MEIKIRNATLKGGAVQLFKRKEQELAAKQVNVPNKGVIVNMVLNECYESLKKYGHKVDVENISLIDKK